MVQEIIYTSSEKGLKQGSRGFCTVVSTVGLPLNLAERLESMSGYRHVFPMGDSRASQNPVCFSHVTTRLAGKTIHVISRIADAGQDYTGRSNKLAHHIAIDSLSGMSTGPARMLCQSGVVVDRWDGEVKTVASRELCSIPAPTEVTLNAWKLVSGDHGWAGAIAEQLTTSSTPVHVIFPLGTDVLALVQEVIDLLPAHQRWGVTFCTYFTRLLAGTECQLRFVLNDTPEASALRKDSKPGLIDLTSPLPPACGGSLVTRARTGVIRLDDPSEDKTPGMSELQVAARARTVAYANANANRGGSTSGTPTPPGLVPAHPTLPFPNPFEQPRRSSRGKWITVAVMLLLVGVASIFIATNGAGNPDKFSQVGTDGTTDAIEMDLSVEALKRQRDAERAAVELKERERLEAEEAERSRKLELERIAQAKAAEQSMANARQEAERRKHEAARLETLKSEGPFAFIKVSVAENDGRWNDEHGQWMFELPKPMSGARAERPLPLRTMGATAQIRTFAGAEHVLTGAAVKVDIEQDSNALNQWKLLSKQGTLTSHLGTYRFEKLDTKGDAAAADTELTFEWAQEAQRESVAAELARWWPIVLSVGTEEATLLQRQPEVPSVVDQIPTWRHLLEKRPITILNSTSLQAVNLLTCPNLRFMLHISELDERSDKPALPQLVELKTLAGAEDPQRGDHVQSVRRFCALRRPIVLQDNPPAIDEIDPGSPGYGEFVLTLRKTEQALDIIPEANAVVRIPSIDFLQQLPSIRLKQRLVDLKKDPTQFPRIAGENFGGAWPEMRRSQEEAVRELSDTMSAFSNNVEHWHRQPLSTLESRKKFVSRFDDLAKDAMRKVKGVLPALKRVAVAARTDQQKYESRRDSLGQTHPDVLSGTYEVKSAQLRTAADEAEAAFRQADVYSSAIAEFQTLLDHLVANMNEAINVSMRDYEKIQLALDAWNLAHNAGEFSVNVVVASEEMPTPNSKSGEKIVLYFVKTHDQK